MNGDDDNIAQFHKGQVDRGPKSQPHNSYSCILSSAHHKECSQKPVVFHNLKPVIFHNLKPDFSSAASHRGHSADCLNSQYLQAALFGMDSISTPLCGVAKVRNKIHDTFLARKLCALPVSHQCRPFDEQKRRKRNRSISQTKPGR